MSCYRIALVVSSRNTELSRRYTGSTARINDSENDLAYDVVLANDLEAAQARIRELERQLGKNDGSRDPQGSHSSSGH